VLAAILAACGERSASASAGTGVYSTWQAQCLQDLAGQVDSEIVSLNAALSFEGLDWDVAADLKEGEALVTIIPRRIPGIRGGGGEFRFSCADKTLELVKAYR